MRGDMCKGPEAGMQTPHTPIKLAVINYTGLGEPRPAPGLLQFLTNAT